MVSREWERGIMVFIRKFFFVGSDFIKLDGILCGFRDLEVLEFF